MVKAKPTMDAAIPQWIAVLLLSLIGGLLLMVWGSLDHRIKVVEDAFQQHLVVSQVKMESFAVLEQRTNDLDRLVRELRATIEKRRSP